MGTTSYRAAGWALAGVLLSMGPVAASTQATRATDVARARRPAASRWVARAVDGAAERLRRRECHAVLREFTIEGRTLEDVLASQGVPAHEYVRRLHFFEGTPALCRGPRMAVTSPGSRVIYICSARFASAAEINPAYVEAAVIHEALHSLGLGENPPSSAYITDRVLAHCTR